MNIDSARVREIVSLTEAVNQSLWSVWPWLYYRRESSVDSLRRQLWHEILVVSNMLSVDMILKNAREENKTLQLFQRWFLEAFNRIFQWEKGIESINAYVNDIWNVTFREASEEVMRNFKIQDRLKIVVEILEVPYGDINGKFIDNVKWLREQWFQFAIDDLDLFRQEKDNISNEILKAVWQHCAKIKLDWKVTRELIKEKRLHHYLISLRKQYPYMTIVLEWIHSEDDIRVFGKLADVFQLSDYPLTNSQ